MFFKNKIQKHIANLVLIKTFSNVIGFFGIFSSKLLVIH